MATYAPGTQFCPGLATKPAHAPFSYEGSCLSFKWEVVARGRRARKLDARASQEISVRP